MKFIWWLIKKLIIELLKILSIPFLMIAIVFMYPIKGLITLYKEYKGEMK